MDGNDRCVKFSVLLLIYEAGFCGMVKELSNGCFVVKQ